MHGLIRNIIPSWNWATFKLSDVAAEIFVSDTNLHITLIADNLILNYQRSHREISINSPNRCSQCRIMRPGFSQLHRNFYPNDFLLIGAK